MDYDLDVEPLETTESFMMTLLTALTKQGILQLHTNSYDAFFFFFSI